MSKLRFRTTNEEEEIEILLEDTDKTIDELKEIALTIITHKREEQIREQFK